LAVGRAQLDLFVAHCQDLVFQVALCLDEFTLGFGVLRLFGFIPLDPVIASFLFIGYDLGHAGDLLSKLFVPDFSLLLNSLALNFLSF
jgi:hypothetical protein